MEWERCVGEGRGGGKSVSQRRPKSIYTFRLRDWELGQGAGGDCGLGSLWLCFFFPPSPGLGMTVLSMPLVAARVGSTNFSLIIFTTFSCVFFFAVFYIEFSWLFLCFSTYALNFLTNNTRRNGEEGRGKAFAI